VTLSGGGTVVTINDAAVQLDDIDLLSVGPGHLIGTLNFTGVTELIPFSVTTGYNLMIAPSASAAQAVIFPNVAAYSVLGNATGSGALLQTIGSAADGDVLRRSGSALGFGTIATAGLADNSVTNAKLRDSAALSVIGRSANSIGDPADIAATAASDAVLRESGSVLGFGTVATGGIANNAVTFDKIQSVTFQNLLGRSGPGSGNTQEVPLSGGLEFTGSAGGLRRSALTGDVTASAGSNATTIANNAVNDAKLRDSGALSVIGRSANSTGDPADISASAASGAVLRESGSTIGFGQLATAAYTDASVTRAKMENMKANSIMVRMSGSAGVPQALDMIDFSANLFATFGFTYTLPCWRLSDGVLGCITI
jgi:hypothetical protein